MLSVFYTDGNAQTTDVARRRRPVYFSAMPTCGQVNRSAKSNYYVAIWELSPPIL